MMNLLKKQLNGRNFLFIALILPLVVVFSRWAKGDFDITHFIVAGDRSIDSTEHPYPMKINENSVGYDGVQFYLYALKPNLKQRRYLGISTDLHYRKQRILYPLVVWLVTGGNPQMVPYAMVLINLLAMYAFIFIGYKIIKEANAPPYYILLLAGLTGMHIALTRNLAEVFEGLFIVLSLYLLWKKKIWGFAIAATAALLSRETSVLIVVIPIILMGIANLKKGKVFYWKNIVISIPLVVLMLWKGGLYLKYGADPRADLQWIPFYGIYDGFQRILTFQMHPDRYGYLLHICYGIYNLVYLSWVVGTLILVLKKLNWKKSLINQWSVGAVWVYFLFGTFLGYPIFISDISFLRVFNGVLLLGFGVLAINRVALSRPYLLITFFLMLVALIRVVAIT